MIITKTPSKTDQFAWSRLFFPAAREALRFILEREEGPRRGILLPAYIGWSSREGSGVFDPVRETKTPYAFYRLRSDLSIDLDDFRRATAQHRGALVLFIHYFGFPDPRLETARKLARMHHATIIEDCAHALFTFFLAPSPQLIADYAIFSLHKMLPYADGGMLLSRRRQHEESSCFYDLFQYNFAAIAERRRQNYSQIADVLAPLAPKLGITLLRPTCDAAVPQTFPILLPAPALRDRLYFTLNGEGYGAVSLYHSLIEEIDASFQQEHRIARHILNLPVHQDATPAQVRRMAKRLTVLVRQWYEDNHNSSSGQGASPP